MPTFKNFKDLEKYIRKAINKAMEAELAQTIKETEREAVQSKVYDAYSPSVYERRGPNGGGLADVENMTSTLIDDGILLVKNETPPNPNYRHTALTSPFIDEAVEYGEEYDYFNPGARRFTQSTIEQLENTGRHIDALMRGLQKQGVDVIAE